MPLLRSSRYLGTTLLAAALGLAACGDAGTEPARRSLGGMQAFAGQTSQSAPAGQTVPVPPAVRVVDSRGRPYFGAQVQFVVTQGGGTLGRRSVYTDTAGVASVLEWRLGSTPGTNRIEARLGTLQPVTFTAVGTSQTDPPGVPTASEAAFGIDVRVVGSMTARQQLAVREAVTRWQTVITTDAPDVQMSVPAGSCFAAQPALNALVDDLVLFVEFVEIDGAGSMLGEAGPCYVRSETSLPIVGYLRLDAADLTRMEQTGTLDDVVLHEIGHVLGIGTLWKHLGLLQGEGGEDPRFTGAKALQAYRALGGLQAGVAVENTGGTGTRDGHWRETEFGDELMTGWIGSYPNPLSALTIASLQDVGYGANALTASQYTLGGTFGARLTAAPVDLQGREKMHRPKYRVDRKGRKERIEH